MSNALPPILEPDPEAMRRQLEHVFFGDLDGAYDGLIELAWNDPKSGALSSAQMFGAGEIDGLVERATKLNRTPNVNVYVGAALRGPGTSRNRRASDADFFAARCVWVDVDNDVVVTAITTCKRLGVPPTLMVVTGRQPHTRAQMWWRLDVPCRDPETLRAICSNIARALGGDPMVVNPGRVLRLGGSVAWPTKTGRVLERTEVHVPDDERPRHYSIEQLVRAFAPEPGPLMDAPPSTDQAIAQAPTPVQSVAARKRHSLLSTVDLILKSTTLRRAPEAPSTTRDSAFGEHGEERLEPVCNLCSKKLPVPCN